MTAFAYLRKSSVNGNIESVSWDVQEAAVKAMAAQHGDDLTILSDWDKSGRLGRDKRPGYDKFLKAIEAGTATAVYAYSLSRIARSLTQMSSLFDLCRKQGVPIRIHADHIDTSTASGKMVAGILAVVAEAEAEIASERILGAYEARRRRGDRLGPRLYGETEGEDVQDVIRAFAETGSFTGAARVLNERGVATRGGKPWQPTSVRVVIRRVAPHLIPRNVARRSKVVGSFRLARLLHCPTCGTVLTGKVGGGKYTRYVCHRASILPHPKGSVAEYVVLDAIKAEAKRLRTPDAVEIIEADRDQMARIAASRERLENGLIDGDISRASFRVQKARLDEQEAAVVARQSVIDIPAIDWDADAPSLNTVLRAMFDSVALDPTTFAPVGFKWADGLEGWIA